MPDPMRSEDVHLKDRRRVVVRPARMGDEEALLGNINLVCAEDVYLMMDEVPWDLERERAWLSKFDGEDNVLFVAEQGGSIVGQADCHRGAYPKIRHTGTIGIAIRDGWREVGLGWVLMNRVLEWMRVKEITDYRDVTRVIDLYYANKEVVMQRVDAERFHMLR